MLDIRVFKQEYMKITKYQFKVLNKSALNLNTVLIANHLSHIRSWEILYFKSLS